MIPGGLSSGEKMLEVMNYPIGFEYWKFTWDTKRRIWDRYKEKKASSKAKQLLTKKKNVYEKFNYSIFLQVVNSVCIVIIFIKTKYWFNQSLCYELSSIIGCLKVITEIGESEENSITLLAVI